MKLRNGTTPAAAIGTGVHSATTRRLDANFAKPAHGVHATIDQNAKNVDTKADYINGATDGIAGG